jgi:GT2 family glycosyltransferase
MSPKVDTLSSPTEIRVSIVIPNYNGAGLLEACLQSISENSNSRGLELIVVDNGSCDASVAVATGFQKVFPSLRLIQNGSNMGVTRALNRGIKEANGKYVALLNNDTVVEKNWLDEVLRVLETDPRIGGAQCKLLKMDNVNRIDSAGCLVDTHGCPLERGTSYGQNETDNGQYDKIEEVFSAGCPASVFRRDILVKAGMFDPEFFTGCEDLDLCWRIRLMGFMVMFVPRAKVLHRRSSTILRSDLTRRTWFHFKKNGLATLVKNYDGRHLIREFPFALYIFFLHGLKDLIVGKDPMAFVASLRALGWNIAQLQYVYRQRLFVQQSLRRVKDDVIRARMTKRCLLIMGYLKPFLKYGPRKNAFAS